MGPGVGFPDAADVCVTVYAWPAMVTCPARSAPGLEATASTTVALALPLVPDWIAIQFAALVAVHAHPFSVATLTDSCPPEASIVSLARLRSKWQGAAA